MSKTTVVNVKQGDYDVYIGRPMVGRPGSPFGNPFRIGVHGTRDEVIDRYREWLTTNPELMGQLESLRGKRLACWCKPARCHGDVLVELLEGPAPRDEQPHQVDLFGDSPPVRRQASRPRP